MFIKLLLLNKNQKNNILTVICGRCTLNTRKQVSFLAKEKASTEEEFSLTILLNFST